MTSDEQKLIELYRQLSEGDKNILMVIHSRLAACEDVPNCRQVKVVNQFHNTIAISEVNHEVRDGDS